MEDYTLVRIDNSYLQTAPASEVYAFHRDLRMWLNNNIGPYVNCWEVWLLGDHHGEFSIGVYFKNVEDALALMLKFDIHKL